ncbi:unnamed protein product [Paramecium sonneborni]|uniref:Uncharacterized protein n=1 Tax=Paramecium sonneborni TaxID=65129 RepID=A0A8S1RPU5_9CILI|nr:unnamed protein product [Paramecium sonneborni]
MRRFLEFVKIQKNKQAISIIEEQQSRIQKVGIFIVIIGSRHSNSHKMVYKQNQRKLIQKSRDYKKVFLNQRNLSINKVQQLLIRIKEKDQSHDGSTSCIYGTPKKQSSFSQYRGYTSHKSSYDELFKRYNKLLQQQQSTIKYNLQLIYYQISIDCNIQISQYMMKRQQTLAEICNILPNRSQTKHNNSVNKEWISQSNQFRCNKKLIENKINYKLLKL